MFNERLNQGKLAINNDVDIAEKRSIKIEEKIK